MKSADKLRSFLQEQFDSQEFPVGERDWREARNYLAARRRSRRLRFLAVPAILVVALGAGWLFLREPGPAANSTAMNAGTKIVQKPITGRPGIAETAVVASPPARQVKPQSSVSHRVAPASLPEDSNPAAEDDRKVMIPQVSPGEARENLMPERLVAMSAVETAEDPTDWESKASAPGHTILSVDNQKDSILQVQLSEKPAAYTFTTAIAPVEPVALPVSDSVAKEARPEARTQQTPALPVTDNTTPIASEPLHAGDSLTQPREFPVADAIVYEAGLAAFYGWNSAAGRDARSLGPVAGISYVNMIHPRCAITFGVQYNRVGALGVSSKTSKVTAFGFGEESEVTVITPVTLHYLVAPLRLRYFTKGRHCFGAGLNLGYLLNVDAKVVKYNQYPGSTANHTETRLSGYTEGFSWYDSQVTLSYGLRVTETLTAGTEMFYGITDVKDDAFFRIDHHERNSGVKISLLYHVFRRHQQ